MAALIDQVKIKVESVRTREHDEKEILTHVQLNFLLRAKVVKIRSQLPIPLKVLMTAKNFMLMYLVCNCA